MGENGSERWAAVLDEVAGALEPVGGEAWLVGGCLRDALLGDEVLDVDLVVSCEPAALARELRRSRRVSVGVLNRDSVRLGIRGAEGEWPLQLDVSPVHGGGIEADLARRDFRVNAMALPLGARGEFVALLARAGGELEQMTAPPTLVDPLGGLADLRARVIVPASDTALADEPGRVIRAGRLAARYDFAASARLLEAARGVVDDMQELSGDRLRGELNALLALPRAGDGLDLLAEVGALTALFPDLERSGAMAHARASVRAAGMLQDGREAYRGMEPLAGLEPLRAWYATPLTDRWPRIVGLRWGLLAHAGGSHGEAEAGQAEEGGRGQAERRGKGLTPVGGERAIVVEVMQAGRWRETLAERAPQEAELRHLFARAGDAAVDALVGAAACNAALAAAPVEGQEYVAAVAEGVRDVLEVYFTDRERLVPPRLLSGDDLARELGMAPGPAVGRVLQEVRRAQLDGRVRTREEALDLARRRGNPTE